jgi:hypothetical protein
MKWPLATKFIVFFSLLFLSFFALLLFSQKGLTYGIETIFFALFRVKLDEKCQGKNLVWINQYSVHQSINIRTDTCPNGPLILPITYGKTSANG